MTQRRNSFRGELGRPVPAVCVPASVAEELGNTAPPRRARLRMGTTTAAEMVMVLVIHVVAGIWDDGSGEAPLLVPSVVGAWVLVSMALVPLRMAFAKFPALYRTMSQLQSKSAFRGRTVKLCSLCFTVRLPDGNSNPWVVLMCSELAIDDFRRDQFLGEFKHLIMNGIQ